MATQSTKSWAWAGVNKPLSYVLLTSAARCQGAMYKLDVPWQQASDCCRTTGLGYDSSGSQSTCHHRGEPAKDSEKTGI